MNTQLFKFSKKWLFLLLIVTTILQVACKKDNAPGMPAIRQVRAISPKPNDSTLTAALPGQIVVIQGSNLATTTNITFNGVDATINSALFSDSTLVVSIPTIDWNAVAQDKLNTVTVKTASGTATYKFKITPPLPLIVSLSNEMAMAGSTLDILGDGFYGITKITFPGGIAVTNFTVTGINKITLVVPAGITTGGPIQVTGSYGTASSILLFNDYTTGMLTTFDDPNYSWGSYAVTDDALLFPNNKGKYSQIAVAGIGGGDGAWYDGVRSMNTNEVTWIQSGHLNDPLDSYALKFEMNLRKPWSGASFYIVKDYTWTYLARFELWKSTGTPITTNGWKTMVIPLTQFKTNANGVDGSGSSAASLSALVGTGKGSLSFMMVNGDATPAPAFDGAFDNFRIVKIK